jgi:hypothetical protein
VKALNKFSSDFFLKYSTGPVKLKPFDPRQRELGNKYIAELETILPDIEIKMRGSSIFEIAGKGETEIGIYPQEQDWDEAVSKLIRRFGRPEQQDPNYAQFVEKISGTEIEIILLKGYEAEVDKKLHAFLSSRPDLLKKYAMIKRKYCFSKREYQRQKNIFFQEIIKLIPDDGNNS